MFSAYRKVSLPLAACAFALAVTSTVALAEPPAAAKASALKLWRLDCGTISVGTLNGFSDTDAYPGRSTVLTVSCYLIRHGDTLMLWDTGLPAALKGKPIDPKLDEDGTVRSTVVEQLAELGVKPSDISIVGVSHYHFDHVGQAADFPTATLMIGKADVDAVKNGAPGSSKEPLAPWITGGGKISQVSGDKDVFGDGSVVMLDLPGHTQGHHGLLIKLASGNIMLSGDLAHFQENYDRDGVPPFNTSRAESLASLARFKELARNLHARVIIEHEPSDIAKLPAFPKAAD